MGGACFIFERYVPWINPIEIDDSNDLEVS
jgi:hypothetical protein